MESQQDELPKGFLGNPLTSESPDDWDRLIEAVGPGSLLVVIGERMSASLKQLLTPEDIWQETLLHAWRDRMKCQWRGVRNFRHWLLTIIDNRIHDAADRENAAKRGGGTSAVPFSVLAASGTTAGESAFPGPPGSTTPSRVAIHREQAAAMREALDSLHADVRDVVRMRLFEQLPIEEISIRLELGASAVRHRFRKGAETYRRALLSAFSSRMRTTGRDNLAAESST